MDALCRTDLYGRVIFTVKTSLDLFSLELEQVSNDTVLGDCICEMKRVTESGPLVNQAPTGN